MKNVYDPESGKAIDCAEYWPGDREIPVIVEIELVDDNQAISFTWPTPEGPDANAILVVPLDRIEKLLEGE